MSSSVVSQVSAVSSPYPSPEVSPHLGAALKSVCSGRLSSSSLDHWSSDHPLTGNMEAEGPQTPGLQPLRDHLMDPRKHTIAKSGGSWAHFCLWIAVGMALDKVGGHHFTLQGGRGSPKVFPPPSSNTVHVALWELCEPTDPSLGMDWLKTRFLTELTISYRGLEVCRVSCLPEKSKDWPQRVGPKPIGRAALKGGRRSGCMHCRNFDMECARELGQEIWTLLVPEGLLKLVHGRASLFEIGGIETVVKLLTQCWC